MTFRLKREAADLAKGVIREGGAIHGNQFQRGHDLFPLLLRRTYKPGKNTVMRKIFFTFFRSPPSGRRGGVIGPWKKNKGTRRRASAARRGRLFFLSWVWPGKEGARSKREGEKSENSTPSFLKVEVPHTMRTNFFSPQRRGRLVREEGQKGPRSMCCPGERIEKCRQKIAVRGRYRRPAGEIFMWGALPACGGEKKERLCPCLGWIET